MWNCSSKPFGKDDGFVLSEVHEDTRVQCLFGKLYLVKYMLSATKRVELCAGFTPSRDAFGQDNSPLR
jgi:hypothetical protein